MTSKKTWTVINVSLGLIAFILLLQLVGVNLPSLGKAQLFFDSNEPFCAAQWKEEINLWQDLDRCCLEARKQLACTQQNILFDEKQFDWVCRTGSGAITYWLNNKAYLYCREQPFWR